MTRTLRCVTALLVLLVLPAVGRAQTTSDRELDARLKELKQRADQFDVVLLRETFTYSSGGRRDPYKSLMNTSELRPLLSDLRLTVVAFDATNGNRSVAILRDLYSKKQYRVRVGQQLGRLKVSAIQQKAVLFTIDEFGFSRTETLPLSSDSTKVRTP
jgi:Tfp pilus assembly protein PilP